MEVREVEGLVEEGEMRKRGEMRKGREKKERRVKRIEQGCGSESAFYFPPGVPDPHLAEFILKSFVDALCTS